MKKLLANSIFVVLFCFICINTYAQKTLQFRVYTVGSTIGDMDGFGAGASDPAWYFRIEDNTYGRVGDGTIDKPGVNCPGTSTVNNVFFSEQYNCALPSSYVFSWEGYEDDGIGKDAATGLNYLPFLAGSINPSQTTWTTLYNVSRQVSGVTCFGSMVTWSIHIQYRVVGTFNNNIAASFALNPKNGCTLPHTVFFTDQSTMPDTWFWNFGDGNTSTAQNPIHTYTSYGTFPVSLTINDTVTGCSDIYRDTVYISNPVANFNANLVTGCYPLTTNFNNTSTVNGGTITSWSWSFGDGNSSVSQNTSNTYTNSGVYTTSLTVTASNGCSNTETKTNYIDVFGANVKFGISDTSFCVGETVNFSDSSSGTIAPITNWIWNFGDGNSSNQQNPTHVYYSPGNYNVTLTVMDTSGCVKSYMDSLVVSGGVANFMMSDSILCLPDTVSFTNQSSGTFDIWQWDFGDGSTSTSNNETHIYTTPINDSVTLYATDTLYGCTDSIKKPIVGYQVSAAYVINNSTSGATFGVCYHDSLSFSSNGTSSPYTNGNFYWDFGDGTTSTDSILKHKYTNGGYYQGLFVETDSLGCSDTTTFNIVVNQPIVSFMEDVNSGCAPLTVNFTDTSYLVDVSPAIAFANVVAYDFGDGNASNSSVTPFNPSHIYNTPGVYQVRYLSGINSNFYSPPNPQCYDTLYTTITVLPIKDTVLYDTACENDTYILPGGDTINAFTGTYFDTITAVNSCDSAIQIELFANPVTIDTVYDSICQGQTYPLPGGGVANSSGQYTDTLTKLITGCDSIVTINLYVYPIVPIVTDTSFCQGDSIFLAGEYINTAGQYYDTLKSVITGCDSVMEYNVVVNPTYFKSESLNLCSGDSIFIGGEWRKTNGTYADSLLTANGCDSIIQTVLSFNDSSHHTVFDTICNGETVFVGGANQSTAGTYYDTLVNSAGCDSILTTILALSPSPNFTITPDTNITIGDQVPIEVTAGYTYQWTPSSGLSCTTCSSPVASPTQTTTYQVTVSQGKCDSVSGITIIVQEEAEIFVPTIFSPNNDNNNDVFKVRGAVFSDFKMVIYNRWGEKVFESDNYTIGWDGTFRGKACLKGSYGYIIEGVDQKGRGFEKKGNITLIR